MSDCKKSSCSWIILLVVFVIAALVALGNAHIINLVPPESQLIRLGVVFIDVSIALLIFLSLIKYLFCPKSKSCCYKSGDAQSCGTGKGQCS